MLPTHDLTMVSDTVTGFLAIEKENSFIGEITNIGSGFEVSIGDLVTIIS